MEAYKDQDAFTFQILVQLYPVSLSLPTELDLALDFFGILRLCSVDAGLGVNDFTILAVASRDS